MLPMRTIRLQLGELLAADATTLAPSSAANKVALVMNDFTPSENLNVSNLTLATFDGGNPISGITGTQPVGLDAQTGDQIITISPPAGGWRWEVTGSANLPQTIFGFALLDDTLSTLLASEKFIPPIGLSSVGQEISIGTITIRLNQNPWI